MLNSKCKISRCTGERLQKPVFAGLGKRVQLRRGVVPPKLTALRKRPPNFRSAAIVSPGGYLLSRDLSSDYHRRADVSLPGSEWDRVGPSGCDHQVSACCALALRRVPGCLLQGWFVVMCAVSGWGGLASAWPWDLQFTIYDLQFLKFARLAARSSESSIESSHPGWC